MGTWVDFRRLREELDFGEVLRHYGVTLKVKRHVQHVGPCPLPSHQGPRRSTSFSANLEKKIFRCFSCSRQGNLIEFAAYMEKLDPGNPQDLRKAALLLAERFGIVTVAPQGANKPPAKKPAATGPALVNVPLDFTLKGLDPEHPYLKSRGFTAETISHFELGFCSRGLMQGRIAIPLRDPKGQLIGYAGRIVEDRLISDENPKYRFPAPREREGKRYEFSKCLFLYNGQAIAATAEELVVVEGFSSVWWLWQHGFRNVVGLMGSTCSPEQAALIVGLVPRRGRIWLLSDGDQAGRYCAEELFKLLAPYRFVRWVELRDNRKPTALGGSELQDLLR